MWENILQLDLWNRLTNISEQFFSVIGDITFFDVADILIVAYLIYKLIQLVRETRAGQLVKGLIIILVAYAVANIFVLKTLRYVISNIISFGVLALVVVFQPELRRILEHMGRSKLSRLNVFSLDERPLDQRIGAQIDKICSAVAAMSLQKIGALICIERATKLGEIVNTGITLNSEVTSELIGSIFFPNSPMHDGAMIIRDDRIIAAGCFLPLSESGDLNKQLGTRHRSAIGLSENSDAVVVIVSEETGIISIALDGTLKRNYDVVSLKNELLRLLLPDRSGEQQERRSVFRRGKKSEK